MSRKIGDVSRRLAIAFVLQGCIVEVDDTASVEEELADDPDAACAPGEKIAGNAGSKGGGYTGGGHSYVRHGNAGKDVVFVGGGGAGGYTDENGTTGDGGAGGGPVGEDGGDGSWTNPTTGQTLDCTGGKGGTLTAGGAGGTGQVNGAPGGYHVGGGTPGVYVAKGGSGQYGGGETGHSISYITQPCQGGGGGGSTYAVGGITEGGNGKIPGREDDPDRMGAGEGADPALGTPATAGRVVVRWGHASL